MRASGLVSQQWDLELVLDWRLECGCEKLRFHSFYDSLGFAQKIKVRIWLLQVWAKGYKHIQGLFWDSGLGLKTKGKSNSVVVGVLFSLGFGSCRVVFKRVCQFSFSDAQSRLQFLFWTSPRTGTCQKLLVRCASNERNVWCVKYVKWLGQNRPPKGQTLNLFYISRVFSISDQKQLTCTLLCDSRWHVKCVKCWAFGRPAPPQTCSIFNVFNVPML